VPLPQIFGNFDIKITSNGYILDGIISRLYACFTCKNGGFDFGTCKLAKHVNVLIYIKHSV